jgi:hypothetical protein
MPALIVAAVLVACVVVVLLAVSQKAEAVLPGKNGRIDLSRDVSVPKKCEAERPSVCRGTQNDDYISGTPMTTRSSLWRAGTTSWGAMVTTRPSADRATIPSKGRTGETISTARRAGTPSSVALGRTLFTPPKAKTKCRRVTATTGYTPLTMGQQTGSIAARATIGSYLAKRTTSPKTARSRAPLVGAA